MNVPQNIAEHFKGLNQQEVLESRRQSGRNELTGKKESKLLFFLLGLAKEPMVLILLTASLIYAFSGQIEDSVFLMVAIVLVAGISWYQSSKTSSALKALKKLSSPKCKVIRDGMVEEIDYEDLVFGDYMVAEEGSMIAADGEIVHSNDFSVNESMLTGESLAVNKDTSNVDHFIYKGTLVTSGLAIARLTAVGNKTRLGSIGSQLETITEEKSLLEIQIQQFVRWMVFAGAVIFVVVWLLNYFNTHLIIKSLLLSLTLAMSILPEEIPVALSSFMALGASRLMRKGVIVKEMKTVETLGRATVICVDKTGTITENKMSIAGVYTLGFGLNENIKTVNDAEVALIRTAMWASEPIPFDPMEIALHEAYRETCTYDERGNYKMYREYPLDGKPPMMTHVFKNETGEYIIAAKGAPEAIVKVCVQSAEINEKINKAVEALAIKGFRVLAIASAQNAHNPFPIQQRDFNFEFIGLVAFFDPPKQSALNAIRQFYDAGIGVKIITGDNAITTQSIAKTIGLKGYKHAISGDELMLLDDASLDECVRSHQVFTRMFPEAKLRVIHALKRNREIVAMTGDGINDALALKAAHIGIAMGQKGTELAKQAAALILLKDNLESMVDAIAMGRRIYTNLKKALRYIISIHIPIILSVFIPLILGWKYPNVLLPVHIIFLELIMGPTCSVIYENEPIEANSMHQKPKEFTGSFLNKKEFMVSVMQGLAITAAALVSYQYAYHEGYSEDVVRSWVFCSLLIANVLLTLENRSFYNSLFVTLRYKNRLMPFIIGTTILLSILIFKVAFLRELFNLSSLSVQTVGALFVINSVAIFWYEILKWIKRKRTITER